MFTHVIFVSLFALTSPGDLAQGEIEPAPVPGVSVRSQISPKSFHEYSRSADEALRAEALAKTLADRAPPVRTLCQLHEELRRDKRCETIEEFAELQNKLFLRLKRVQASLAKPVAKLPPMAKRFERGPGSASGVLAGAAQSAAPQALGGGAVADDHGQELVDLIQRTIQPDVWDVNGGRSTMVYFAPLKVLVVSAPGEVHGDVGGVLQGLRAAGP